jgi:hypothetical protein
MLLTTATRPEAVAPGTTANSKRSRGGRVRVHARAAGELNPRGAPGDAGESAAGRVAVARRRLIAFQENVLSRETPNRPLDTRSPADSPAFEPPFFPAQIISKPALKVSRIAMPTAGRDEIRHENDNSLAVIPNFTSSRFG